MLEIIASIWVLVYRVLAIIGVVLFFLNLTDLGFLLMLPALITFFVKIVWRIGKDIVAAKQEQKYNEMVSARKEREHQERIRKQQGTIAQQKELVNRYMNSPLTKEILNVICNGDPTKNVPNHIIIYQNCVKGILGQREIIFDFAAHRVHNFNVAIMTAEKIEEFNYLVKPQVALAEAINHLMSNKYKVVDNYKLESKRDEIDGELFFLHTYVADSVNLTLKSILPNRTF